jgi:hypothetical protein
MTKTVEQKRREDREYWRKNRERLNQKRRERYANNPQLQAKHKERCRRQYDQRQSLRPHQGRKLRRLPKRAKLKIDSHHVVNILVVPVSYLAYKLGVQSRTIKGWERSGVLPEMGWRGKGHRYWPILFVEICRDVIRDLVPEGVGPGIKLTDRGIKEEVIKRWQKGKKKYLSDPNYGLHYFRLNEKDNNGTQESSTESHPQEGRKKAARKKNRTSG